MDQQNLTKKSSSFIEPAHLKDRHIGIAYTLFAWFLIALSSIFFVHSKKSHSFANTFFHHYLAAFMAISLWAAFTQKKNFFCRNPFLVIFNSIICMTCYYIYFLLRMAPASVVNSYLLNADVIILALASVFIFKQKINLLAWVGLVIGFIGVMSFFSFQVDFSSFSAMYDATICLLSSTLMVVLILFTQYLLKNNPPIIVALSHCLVGLVVSGILLFFSGWQLPTNFELFCMVVDGVIYGISLYFFITALKYTEAYVIIALSYSLPVYLILINLALGRGGVNLSTVIGMVLVVMGIVLVPFSVYLKDRKAQDEADARANEV